MTKPSKTLTALLTKAQIFAAPDLKAEDVAVPEWGGTVRVTGMTGTARDAWEQMLLKDGKADVANARAKLVAVSVIDEEGNLMFSADDVEILGRKSAAALNRVATVAQRLSKLAQSDLEDAVKN